MISRSLLCLSRRQTWSSRHLPKTNAVRLLLNSNLPPHTKITILPEWREDGELNISQNLSSSDAEVSFDVDRSGDLTTITSSSSSASTPSSSEPSSLYPPLGFGNTHPDGDWPSTPYTSSSTSSPAPFSSPPETSSLDVTLKVPSKLNLHVSLSSGDVDIVKKLEGDDIHVSTDDGSIIVSKLRAHRISLVADKFVGVKTLVEAEDGRIAGGRIRAKMLNGRRMVLEGTRSDLLFSDGDFFSFLNAFDEDDGGAKIDVGSLYTSDTDPAFVSTSHDPSGPFDCAVRIKNSHGGLNVDVESKGAGVVGGAIDKYGRKGALVELGGISGSCNVVTKGEADLAARVHFDSLFTSGWSSVSVSSGSAEVTVDRKIHAELRMLSSCGAFDEEHGGILDGDVPLPEEITGESERDGDLSSSRIKVKTSAFKPTLNSSVASFLDYCEGEVFNNTLEPDSRFEVMAGNMKRSSGATGGGKVDVEGAEKSALDAFGGQKKDGGEEELHVITVGVGEKGEISLETLEWMETIKRRFGMGRGEGERSEP